MLHAAHVRWLREQLPLLVGAGVLGEEEARRLAAHYEGARGAGARAVVVLFGTLGALFVGGGVILLLAHNWDQLSRAMRTALSVAPLLGALGLAAWAIRREPRSEAWSEGVGALWVLSLGASISLVAQTYHLPGDWTTFLLTWLLLAAPIVCLLEAVSAALLYCLGLAAWALSTVSGPGTSLLFWALLVVPAGFAWLRLRREPEGVGSELLGWALALTVACGVLPSFERLDELIWGPLLATVTLALWALGVLAQPHRWERPFRIVGGAGFLGTAFVLSFGDAWGHVYRTGMPAGSPRLALEGAVLAGVLLAAAALLYGALRRRGADAAPLVAGPPVAWLALLLAETSGEEAAAVLVNVYLLALGVTLLVRGMRDESLRRANVGTAVVGLLILFRFFDTDWGFLVRGTAFIAVGLAFLLVNLRLLRRRAA
jgi:uncharacterized membrane protein